MSDPHAHALRNFTKNSEVNKKLALTQEKASVTLQRLKCLLATLLTWSAIVEYERKSSQNRPVSEQTANGF